MERTVTIPLSEYEHLKRVNKELQVEVRRANEVAGKWLDKLGEVAQVVAFLTSDDDEDESDDGSESGSSISDSYATISEMVAGLSAAASPGWCEYVNIGGSH